MAGLIIERMRGSFGAPPVAASGASSPGQPGDGSIQPATLDQLGWLGIPMDAIDRLRPFVAAARPTAINLNTAPREVLAAVIDKASLADAERIVQERTRTPLRSLEDTKRLLPPGHAAGPGTTGRRQQLL